MPSGPGDFEGLQEKTVVLISSSVNGCSRKLCCGGVSCSVGDHKFGYRESNILFEVLNKLMK